MSKAMNDVSSRALEGNWGHWWHRFPALPRGVLFFCLILPMIISVILAGPLWAGEGAKSTAGNDAGFVPGFSALPLMEGLQIVPDSEVVFDTPSGRIVEAEARGVVSQAEILAFYGRTLPQLGWERAGDTQYRREEEVLRLEITRSDNAAPTIVHFFLSPR